MTLTDRKCQGRQHSMGKNAADLLEIKRSLEGNVFGLVEVAAGVEVLVVRQVNVGAGGSLSHKSFKLRKIMLIDSSRGRILVLADAGGHSDNLAHHRTRAHKPCGTQGDVRDGDVSPSHEEVVHISGIQAAVRH